MTSPFIRSAAEQLLASVTNICAHHHFPFDAIRLFAFDGCDPLWGLHYNGRHWTNFHSGWGEEVWKSLYEETNYIAELRAYHDCPFAILWLGDLDRAQEVLGFRVPWVTLGYLDRSGVFRRTFLCAAASTDETGDEAEAPDGKIPQSKTPGSF